jgi:hypothetical protein
MWEPSDTSRLREYHQRTSGKLRAYLASRIPLITGTTIESVALEAKFKEGCEHILREIDALLEAPKPIDDSATGTYQSM